MTFFVCIYYKYFTLETIFFKAILKGDLLFETAEWETTLSWNYVFINEIKINSGELSHWQ